MLNQWRKPWWCELVEIVILGVYRLFEMITNVSFVLLPFIALYLMVKLTPFFLSLR